MATDRVHSIHLRVSDKLKLKIGHAVVDSKISQQDFVIAAVEFYLSTEKITKAKKNEILLNNSDP